MAELDQIFICNPLETEFEVGYNGEPYKLEAGEEKTLPHHLARHFAKHISDKMCALHAEGIREEYVKRKEKMPDVLYSQLTMLDNPIRRISLYKCLRSKGEVERTVKCYPQFKANDKKFNFVGEIKEYDDFVASYEAEKSAPKKKDDPKEAEKPSEESDKKTTEKKEEKTSS